MRRKNKKKSKPRKQLSPSQIEKLKIYLAVGIIIISAIAAFANSFKGKFIYDDENALLKNTHIRSLWPLSEAMSLPAMNKGLTLSGRPILSLTFALNYKLCQYNLWGYHLINFLIHIAAGLLLFGIIHRTLCLPQFKDEFHSSSIWISMIIAVIWLIHPLQTESVTYIVQRAESMMGMLFLLALYSAILGMTTNRKKWYIVTFVSCALGMATKEVMVTAPVIIFLYDYVFISQSFKNIFRKRLWLYPALAATWSISIILIIMSKQMITEDVAKIGCFRYAIQQPASILHYLKMAFWPYPLIMDYGTPDRSLAVLIITNIIVTVLLIVTAWAIYRKKWFGFIASWFFIILAPSSSFAPTAQIVHDHRIYLPLAGIIAIIVISAYQFRKKKLILQLGRPAANFLVFVSAMMIIFTLIGMTNRRNEMYHNDIKFWQENAKIEPASLRAHSNLAHIFMLNGDYKDALVHYKGALAALPNDISIIRDLGSAYLALGELDQAKEQYEKVLSIDPNHITATYYLANVLFRQNDFSSAKERYIQVIKSNSTDSISARNNLGLILIKEEKLEEAKKVFQEIINLDPNYENALVNLTKLLYRLDKFDEAVNCYEKVIASDPNNAVAMKELAWLLATIDRDQFRDGPKAIQLANQACQLTNYKKSDPLLALSAAFAQTGDFKKALETAKRAFKAERSQPSPDDRKLKKIAICIEFYQAKKPLYIKP